MLGRGMATAKAKAAKESKGAAKGAKESKSPEGASGGALAALHGVFESERATCIAIDAFPAGDDRLFLAVEAIEPQLHGKSASAILAVTLGKKPTFEVLHASARSAHDYLYDEASDTHFLLQGGGLLRLRAGVESFTPLDQSLDRIALAGDTVVACGGTEVVAITEAGKVERIPVETAFELRAIVSDGERLFAAGRGGVFFVGDRRGLEPVKLPANAFKLPHADGRLDILSLHPTPDGALLIGGRDGAARYEGGAVSMLELDHYGTWGRAACVDGATELYAVEHGATRSCCTGALAPRSRRWRVRSSKRSGRDSCPTRARGCTRGATSSSSASTTPFTSARVASGGRSRSSLMRRC